MFEFNHKKPSSNIRFLWVMLHERFFSNENQMLKIKIISIKLLRFFYNKCNIVLILPKYYFSNEFLI